MSSQPIFTHILIPAVLLLLLFSHVHAAGEICDSMNPCVTADEVCDVNGVCVPIVLEDVIPTNGALSSGTGKAHVLFLSDAQFYFVICKENPKEECIYNGLPDTTSLSDKKALLDAAAIRQKECLDHLSTSLIPAPLAMFDNGDLTNSGEDEETLAIEEFHNVQLGSIPLPLIVSLGNHDYKLATGAKAVGVLSYFERAMERLAARAAVRAVDYQTTDVVENYGISPPRNEKFSKGSMGYSVEINGYVFIMLHWGVAVGTTDGRFTASFSEYDVVNDAVHHIDITDITGFLLSELTAAKAEGKQVVLVPHSWKGLQKFATSPNPSGVDIMTALCESTVVAVVSGHVHDAYGLDNRWRIKTSGCTRDTGYNNRIPVFYAGSASYEKVIAVELKNAGRGLAVTVYDSSMGSSCAPTSSSTQSD